MLWINDISNLTNCSCMGVHCKDCGNVTDPLMILLTIIVIILGLFTSIYSLITSNLFSLVMGVLICGFSFFYIMSQDYCRKCQTKRNHTTFEIMRKSDSIIGKIIDRKLKLNPDFPKYVTPDYLIKFYETDVNKIQQYEAAGNCMMAAKCYEKLGLMDEAKRLRSVNRTRKEVKVDLNTLIDQLNERNLILSIKCTSCGAPIDVNTSNAGGLKFCNYCGSALDVISIHELLSKALA